MKRIIPFIIGISLVVGCSKENNITSYNKIDVIKAALRDSMCWPQYAALNFDGAVYYHVDSAKLSFLKIPFARKGTETDFVLLETVGLHSIKRGMIVHMEEHKQETTRSGLGETSFNGVILLHHLNGVELIRSSVVSGYITAFHIADRTEHKKPPLNNAYAPVQPAEPSYVELPEVIVVSHRNSSGGGYSSSWLSLQGFFGGGGGGGGSHYAPMSGGTGGGGGSNSSSGYYSSVPIDEGNTIFIEIEAQQNKPSIDIIKYLSCFSNLPDAGADCSIEIFADVPVDKDPTMLFDRGTLSPGHVFINLTKRNGDAIVSQNIGWYPASTIKPAITTAPVQGKFVDNAKHEFNASFKVNLNVYQFQKVVTYIKSIAGIIKYDIDDFNCTDFALNVFNYARIAKVTIPLFDLPGDNSSTKASTPNGLFFKLVEMKNNNHPESNNITTNIIEGFAGGSSGPCN